jgi:hypothetical protein
MSSAGKVQWAKLRDFFFRLGSCKTRRELLYAASVEIQHLIPYDQTAGIFRASDGLNFEGVGKSEACTAAFNNYYRTKIPPHSTFITD